MHSVRNAFNKIPILALIVCLAAVLRFWQLGSIPVSLNWDEVAWGYNAYSIGIDGKDEFGKFLPFEYLESYGDFKPPVYAYADVLPIKLFGLTPFATRFPSALFGTLTVLLTYFLVKRIFPDTKQKEQIALIATLLLAVSPWHINLSRAAFEANIASFFLVCGVWAFLAGIQNRRRLLILSAFAFALSFYTFNTPRIVAPLLVVGFGIGFYRQLFERRKETILAIITGLLLVGPLVPFLFSPQARLRFQEVNIFSDVTIAQRTNQQIMNDNNALWSKIIHNRRVAFGLEYIKHYLDHAKPNFLFITGDENLKFSTRDMGQLYVWELPFLIVGVFFLFRKKKGYWWVIPYWMIVGIIPAATARETPHALRIETILPTLQICSAIGVSVVIYAIRKHIPTKEVLFVRGIFLLLAMSVMYYLHGYYVHYPRESAKDWNYGYQEALQYTRENEEKYDQILFTRNLGRPYMYHLFYNAVHPEYFRRNAEITRDAFGFVDVKRVGKYYFSGQLDSVPEVGENKLYVEVAESTPLGVSDLKTFNLLNGEPILKAYTR